LQSGSTSDVYFLCNAETTRNSGGVVPRNNIPLIFGLSLQALPELYAQVIPWLRPLFGSALTLATVLAVALNLLLRIRSPKQREASAISGEA
jgi:xanthine/uracil permease